MARVAIVGAGISGAACAVALHAAGADVEMLDRGRAPGGRLASPELHGRRVDLGAAYFTVGDPAFGEVADRWRARGLARKWTDTLDVLDGEGRHRTTGKMRWATPLGLRSLARDLLPVEVVREREITALDELDHDAVVLAMPDPQAARLLGQDALDWVDYEPVIAVAMAWPARRWHLDAAAFVNDDPDVTLIADDGARRDDRAPVLVVHSTAQRARRHLDQPDGAIAPVVRATRRLLGIDTPPVWTHAHRWGLAKPGRAHDRSFALLERAGTDVGVCGDSWCPEGAPRVESAWLSGTRLGAALAARLA